MRVVKRIFHQVRDRIKGSPNKIAPGEDAELKELLFTEGYWFYAINSNLNPNSALALPLPLTLTLALPLPLPLTLTP